MTDRDHARAQTSSTTEPLPARDIPAHEDPLFEEIDPADLEPQPFRAPDRRRVLAVIAVILILLGLALGPPLVNVSRYRREIASSIGASLGRPVHLDSVSLNLLPVPSFTLENFAVSEDPAFGSEPVLRANRVRATLRLSSLWRHKVEFSTITLEDPSVNLVHLPDGRWNLESILLQASRVPVAPTAQKETSEAPRFPYIEATGARVNLKMGQVKQPLSLTEARFALWLPEPNQWHLRLEGHPNRTDVPATDTGKFSVEGTLGRAATLEAVPVDLDAGWSAAPLGGVSWVVLGRDLGVRGDLTLHAQVKGTVGANRIATGLELHGIRRADFVPARTLDVDMECSANALDDLHRLDQIGCHWPRLEASHGLLDMLPSPQPALPGLSVGGTLPELMRPASVNVQVSWNSVPAAALLDALRAASPRVSPALDAAGTFSGDIFCCAALPAASAGSPIATTALPAGSATRPHSGIASPAENATPPQPPVAFTITGARLGLGDGPPIMNQTISAAATGDHIVVEPLSLNLGAPDPATLTVIADWTGLHMHLTGPADRDRLLALATALPQFGDGLAAILPEPVPVPATPATPPAVPTPLHLDADATRLWLGSQFGGQTWTAAAPRPADPPRRKPIAKHRHGN